MNQANPQAPQVSVAAPAYNEEESIEKVVREWKAVLDRLGMRGEIVVCNDGSTDRTGEILERLEGEIDELVVVGDGVNRGYGYAASTAIAGCTGEYVATIDSDGQFDLANVEQLFAKLGEGRYDGVTGYRKHKNDSLLRVVADRILVTIVRLLFGTRLRDTNCALKLIARERLQALTLESRSFSLPTEICVKLEAEGGTWGECPVDHREREAGASKLKVWSTGWRMLRYLLYLRQRIGLVRAGVLRRI